MDSTMDLINKLASERLVLYRRAGEQHLTAEQLKRIHEITAQLPVLWDRHRREIASRSYRQPSTVEALRSAA